RRCTGDLTGIIAADGTLEQTCPADKLCAGATCIDACDAAAKARGAAGCDFLVTEPPLAVTPPCFIARVTNTSALPMKMKVSYGGTDLPVEAFTRVSRVGLLSDPFTQQQWAELPADGVPGGYTAFLYLSGTPGAMERSWPAFHDGEDQLVSFDCPFP